MGGKVRREREGRGNDCSYSGKIFIFRCLWLHFGTYILDTTVGMYIVSPTHACPTCVLLHTVLPVSVSFQPVMLVMSINSKGCTMYILTNVCFVWQRSVYVSGQCVHT